MLEELRRYLFFEPLPFVSRVVFLATPHRGSDLSRGVVGRVGTSLISDPDHIHKLLYHLVKDNPNSLRLAAIPPLPNQHRDPGHGLANPDGPAEDEAGPGRVVPLDHRVDTDRRAKDQSTDGVVPYRSSHLDGRRLARRSCARTTASRRHPEAISEVRRILCEHLGMPRPGPGVQEARGPGATEPVRLEPPTTVR